MDYLINPENPGDWQRFRNSELDNYLDERGFLEIEGASNPEGRTGELILCEHAYHCDSLECPGQTGRVFDPDEEEAGLNRCNLIGRVLQVVSDVVVDPAYERMDFNKRGAK